MAIAFARIVWVRRGSNHSNKSSSKGASKSSHSISSSTGTTSGNMCLKSAYISRNRIESDQTPFEKKAVYDFRHKEGCIYTKLLLPSNAAERFKDNPQAIWNAAHKAELRKDSRLGGEMVLALPSDECVSDELRKKMLIEFIQKEFIDRGLGVQIAIHIDENGRENIHAHILFTIRRFDGKDGEFGSRRPQDLFPDRGKGVMFARDWGKIWAQFQNRFFREHGIDLKVDPVSVHPQEHKGCIRMRGDSNILNMKWEDRHEIALKMTKDPKVLAASMVLRDEIFSETGVRRIAEHFLAEPETDQVLKSLFSLSNVIPLFDPTGKKTRWYTTSSVLEDTRSLDRLASRLSAKSLTSKSLDCDLLALREEQKKAYLSIAQGSNLSLLQGDAGTGKSYVLRPLSETYQAQGITVRGLGPDNGTVELLKKDGIPHSESIHSFLWSKKRGNRSITTNKEVWIIDEAGKANTDTMLELLRAADHHGAKVILVGDAKQCPPVGRGQPFSCLCKKFGSAHLVDIQRQNTEEKKKFAKDLAAGDVGSALHKMLSKKWLVWNTTLDDSRQALIDRWKEDNRELSRGSSLIIAATNREVRLLNQMIREIRKEWGEIGKEDMELTTKIGTDSNRSVFASVGDVIEFRKKDKDLQVLNGTQATIRTITKNKVTVRDNDNREFSFNPKKYKSWTLGYASTNYRSQGNTVDRCYVLHEPSMNKPNFYVGLTRHRDQVMMFVSKEKVRSLSALRYQMLKKDETPSLYDLKTQGEIEAEKTRQKTAEKVEKLRSSDRFIDKTKAEAVNLLGKAKQSIGTLFQRYRDKTSSKEFYTIKEEEIDLRQMARSPIQKTSWNELFSKSETNLLGDFLDACDPSTQNSKTPTPNLKNTARELVTAVDKERLTNALGPALTNQAFHLASSQTNGESVPTKEEPFPEKSRAPNWKGLELDQKRALEMFLKTSNAANDLKELYEESKLDEWKQKWFARCRERNEYAFEASKIVTRKEVEISLGEKRAQFLFNKADKHREGLEKPQEIKRISAQLTERMGELAVELIGERPTNKSPGELRFGRKGSLSVKISGSHAGTWKDFESDEKGDPFKLISRYRNCNFTDSLNYARTFLGHPRKEIPKEWVIHEKKTQNPWKSVAPPSGHQNPRKREFDGLSEKARYAYKDSQGKLLFYVLRFEKNASPGTKNPKLTLPFTYGSENGGKCYWRLKGWSQGPSIYGLDLLEKEKEKPILIVEGEKAADAARSQYGDKYACISWNGGCSNAGKVDWTPLAGRDVIIWPDNDQPGYKAGNTIAQKAVLAAAHRIRMVDPKELHEKLEKGWDLADALPEGLTTKEVKNRLLLAKEVAPSVDGIISLVSKQDSLPKNTINKLTKELISLSMERITEKNTLPTQESRKQIMNEVIGILKNASETKTLIGPSNNQSRLLVETLKYQACTGKEPTQTIIDSLKETLREEKLLAEPTTSRFQNIISPENVTSPLKQPQKPEPSRSFSISR